MIVPADPETGVEIGVHAVYPDDAYSAKRLGTYLGALEDAWGVCLSLGALRVSEEGWEPPDSWSEIDTQTPISIRGLRSARTCSLSASVGRRNRWTWHSTFTVGKASPPSSTDATCSSR